MEQSILHAIERIRNRFENRELRSILLDFYRDRTLEILGHLEEKGIGKVVDFENMKIGGTSNDD